MAADTTHLIETYSRTAKAHILPRLNALSMCNRTFEGDARGATQVKITTDTRGTNSYSDVGRDGDWPAPQDIGTSRDTLDIDQDPAVARRVAWLDDYDVPVAMVQRAAYWNNREMAEVIDADIYTTALAGVPAGQKTTLGNSDLFIPVNGVLPDSMSEVNKTATRALIPNALFALSTALQVANKKDLGIDQYRWQVRLSPAHAQMLDEWLLANDQQVTRNLKEDIIRTTGVVGDSYRMSFRDFDIYETNAIPTTELTSKTHSQIIVSNPAAMTFAMGTMLAQVFTPQENQGEKAGWLFRQRNHYGRKVIDDRFIYSYQVRTEA